MRRAFVSESAKAARITSECSILFERALSMIETIVESIRVNLVSNNRVVILKEVSGERHLPIWIGEFEANAIVIELRHQTAPRPLAYDLLRSAIDALGGTVERVIVSDLSQDVFFARIIISQSGQLIELDSRPSDAIALSLRCQCPIFVEESVMEKAGVSLSDEDVDTANSEESLGAESTEAVAESGDELSIFRDFIDTLDLDDFGRPR